MDVLTNETRVKMLLPLLEQPQGKRHFREDINPKLIYENVPLLQTHKLIDELSDDLYGLTTMGKMILGEYLAFVEKVRHLLEQEREE
jgi:predicted transcriptional regulator